MATFYNGVKLFNTTDLDGDAPECRCVVGNRIGGKSFFFKKHFVRRFLKKTGEKVGLLVRYINDIPGYDKKFWSDIGPKVFPSHDIELKPLFNGGVGSLKIDGRDFAYVVPLNKPVRNKECSALLSEVSDLFFDEFMAEDGRYLPDEYDKFDSLRLSVSRAGARTGAAVRTVPTYFAGNAVSVFNPYFDQWGVASRIRNDTKMLKGHGWIVEQYYNKDAADLVTTSYKTLGTKHLEYATNNEYLLDVNNFCKKIPGMKKQVCRLIVSGRAYGLWEMGGIFYVSSSPGESRVSYACDHDHTAGTLRMSASLDIAKAGRKAYDLGLVWFENPQCRRAFLTIFGMPE